MVGITNGNPSSKSSSTVVTDLWSLAMLTTEVSYWSPCPLLSLSFSSSAQYTVGSLSFSMFISRDRSKSKEGNILSCTFHVVGREISSCSRLPPHTKHGQTGSVLPDHWLTPILYAECSAVLLTCLPDSLSDFSGQWSFHLVLHTSLSLPTKCESRSFTRTFTEWKILKSKS